ncbi:type III secretion system cytoplasmic ring protein SctQ [Castellaniella hirudinis]|uniref:Type III secretion system cytoplasmic ring protein SctQ n=1 Tax=Castellaniella hirudinis TaxID=1144617 RepID=A0ABV8RX03_9BURK
MDAMNFSTARTAVLPRLSASQAQALTLVATHGADLRVGLPALEGAEAAPGVWRLGLTPGATPALRQAASLRSDLEWAGAALRLSLPPSALAAWTDARLPDLGPGELPEVLQAAALETLLAEAVAALTPVSAGGPVRVLTEPRDVVLPHVWTLSARAEARGETVLAVLESDDLGLMLLAGLLGQVPPGAGGIDEAALPVRLRAEIGRAVLSVDELHALDAGDVILLTEYLVDTTGGLWLGIPQGQGLRVRAEQASYLVTQGWTSLMAQTDSPVEDTSSAEPLNLDAIPVRLSFDLGDRALPLAELRQLQPGAVFDLQRPLADGPVMIRANGALVGTGELVEVDGRIGVRVGTLGRR